MSADQKRIGTALLMTRMPVSPLDDLLSISRELSAGMAAAPEAGIVHGDLKPENVWHSRLPTCSRSWSRSARSIPTAW